MEMLKKALTKEAKKLVKKLTKKRTIKKKSTTQPLFSSQTGSGRGKFERGNLPAPKRVAAKDTPFDADLDTPQVSGRAGGRAATAKSARAGVINIGDDAVGFNNFLRLQESRGILKREKAMRALEKIIENGTDKQKAKAKTMLKKMKSAALKSDITATRKQTGGQRGKAKPDDFAIAQKKLEEDGVMEEEFKRLTKNEQDRLIQSTKKKQMLKKQKEMPSDEAKAKKKLVQKIMATNPRRGKAQGGMRLKTPTTDQTGLKKLPTAVRNKMGYMYGGGMAKKPKMGSMDYRKGGLLLIAVDMMKKKKKKGK